MLIPKKHLRLSESILGFSSEILKLVLKDSRTLDEIYSEIRQKQKNKEITTKLGFDNILLSLGFLYSIGVISMEESGKIKIK